MATNPTGRGVGEDLSFTTANSNPVANDRALHAPAIGVGTVVYSVGETSDADADARTLTVLNYAGSGSTSSEDNQIVYRSSGFVGSEIIEVQVSDDYGGSDLATVTLRNVAPVASADRFTISAGGTTFTVLANDSDADSDALVITDVSAVAGGTVTSDGQKLTYIPGEGFRGFDQFTYTVSDGHGGTASAEVTVLADYSVARTVAMKNDEVPGGGAAVWTRFGAPSIFSQGTKAGWLATTKSASERSEAIFSGQIGAPVLRVRAGDAAPDGHGTALSGGVKFRHFRSQCSVAITLLLSPR